MPQYHRINKSEKESLKRCPECGLDSMRFDQFADAWVCFNISCGSRICQELFQTPLPTSAKLEQDELQPNDTLTNRERPFMKSFSSNDSYDRYSQSQESDLNLNLSDSIVMYRGSGADAIRQDNYRRDIDIAKAKRIEYKTRSNIIVTL